ncbi:MAG: S8 family serine peptidase, partial [candidate division Zixibacteria bacterium]|nr:S8 family serine peptidase [candidate division Zixibacteria bacterium]
MIHRNRFLQCVLFLALSSLAVGAAGQAPFSAPPVGEYPAQLVVKFTADQHFDTKMRGGRLSIGKFELDGLNDKYETQSQERLLKNAVAVTYDNPLKNVYILLVPQGTDLEAMAREFEQLDIVEYAHPDYPFELHEMPDDPLLEHQWALNNTGQGHYHVERLEGDNNDTLAIVYGTPGADIHAGPVFEAPPDQTDVVVVAIIDTGVDSDHPDLAGRIWANPGEIPENGIDDDHNGYSDDTWGWDFSANDTASMPIYEDNEPDDYIGHGTHCAGIVAALIDNATGVAGVVPEAKIMTIKIFPIALHSTIARAVTYAADNGADVISMSFGGLFGSDVTYDVMDYARARGVVLLASAGNTGYQSVNYPAAYPQVMCISASNDQDQITTWSTYNDYVSVCAPGQSVLSLLAAGTDLYAGHNEPGVHIIDSLYYLASGTSMSCPYAASVAAYIRSVSPGLDPEDVRTILELTADDIVDPYGLGENYPGWDIYSGHGRVNLFEALAIVPQVRAVLESPQRFEVVTGTFDILGSADGQDFTGYILDYTVDVADTQWIEIAVSSMPVTGGLLGTLETTGFDASIVIRLRVGDQNATKRTVFVSNAVFAELLVPADNDTISGLVDVTGFASCPEFAYSILEYGTGSAPADWETIDTIGVPAFGGTILTWETGTILDGAYSLRLLMHSTSGLEASDTTIVLIHSPFAGANGWMADLNDQPGMSANYGDFDDDGLNEIVIGTKVGVQFFNTDGSPKTSGVPEFPEDDYRFTLAVGNLDGDGVDDLVAVSYGGGILYGFPSSMPAFEVTLPNPPEPFFTSWQCGPMVYLKDINNDGLDEIHFNPGYWHWDERPSFYYLFRADGTEWGHGFPPPDEYVPCFPADLSGDLIDEVYCYNASNHHLVEFDTLGQAQDSVVVEIEGLTLERSWISFSAVDIDDDQIHELTILGFSTTDPYYPPANTNHYVFAFDDGLQLMEGWPHNTGVWGFWDTSHPVFGDLDGDDQLEYAMTFGDWVYSRVHAWHLDGTPYVGDSGGFFASPPGPSSTHDLVMVDVSDDGLEDIVLGVSRDLFRTNMLERIVAFDGTGEVVQGYPMVVQWPVSTSVTWACPAHGDINQDGYVDFVYPWFDKLVFANLEGCDYYPNEAPWPMRRGNRRQNATARLTSETTIPCGDINGSGQPTDIADLVYMV